MIRSMTGFGSAEGPVGSARVSVELRSVNHRFFSPSLKLPAALSRWEGEVRDALRRHIARGHVTVSARIERTTDETAVVDEQKFARYAGLLLGLRDRHGLGGDVDVATVLRMPDVLRFGDEDDIEGRVDELVAVVEAAAGELTAAREAEGRRLAAVLRDRLGVVEAAVARLAARAPARVAAQRERLRENVRALCDGLAVDEQRLAQEIAFLADRLDVGEELDRFRAHLTAFREALEAPDGELVGKRLGFILQEMLREANTAGSKANDAVMQQDVVLVKEELERLREQVENLE
jgi:uncharacterized protein (TIGR00255 family)